MGRNNYQIAKDVIGAIVRGKSPDEADLMYCVKALGWAVVISIVYFAALQFIITSAVYPTLCNTRTFVPALMVTEASCEFRAQSQNLPVNSAVYLEKAVCGSPGAMDCSSPWTGARCCVVRKVVGFAPWAAPNLTGGYPGRH